MSSRRTEPAHPLRPACAGESKRSRPASAFALGLVLALVLGLVSRGWVPRTVQLPPLGPGTLPCYGQVADVALLAADGQPVGTRDLRGRIWLVGFIFTHCETVCPLLTQDLEALAVRLQGVQGVRAVSVTVDPWRDAPDRLAAYARDHGARRTLFLTGEPASILALMQSVQLASRQVQRLEPETHSAGLALVDSLGRVRGLYYRRTSAEHDRIVRDVVRLATVPAEQGRVR